MKKIVVKIIILILIAITIFSCGKKEENVIKIGAILPLSGDAAVYGKSLQTGINLALDEYNAKTTTLSKIKIVYEDSKADPRLSVNSFEKLYSIDRCKIIIGGFTSTEALSIAPIAEKNRIVFISPTASSPKLTTAGDYIFRTTPSDNFDGKIMAKFAFERLHLNTVGILYVNSVYGQGISEIFRQHLHDLGGKVVIEKTFEASATDFRTQLLSIKLANPQGIYIIASSELGNILKQIRELNLRQKLLTVGLAENPNVVKLAGESSDTVFYSYPSFQIESLSPIVKTFVDNYHSKYLEEPDVLGAYGYDLMNIIIKALEDCNFDLNKVKDAFYKIKNFPGVTGETSFDINGDVEKVAGIKMIVNGKFKWFINNFE